MDLKYMDQCFGKPVYCDPTAESTSKPSVESADEPSGRNPGGEPLKYKQNVSIQNWLSPNYTIKYPIYKVETIKYLVRIKKYIDSPRIINSIMHLHNYNYCASSNNMKNRQSIADQ